MEKKLSFFIILGIILLPVCTAVAEITYQGQDGTTMDNAVVILGAPNEFAGVEAEYQWLETKFGPENEVWKSGNQGLVSDEDKWFDVLDIEFLQDADGYQAGDVVQFYFDITDFFGKW